MGGSCWLVTSVVCWVLFVGQAEGGTCESIQGSWFNELGAEIQLIELDNGTIVGKFYSDLERATGTPGRITHSPVDGYMPYKKVGDVFGFTVSFLNGATTKAWTGQCQVCSDGKERLVTSWLMRSTVKSCRDKWKSTMIGQDTFTREKPSDEMTVDLEMENNVPYHIDVDVVSLDDRAHNRPPKPAGKDKCADITGTWYNDVGSEVILSQDATGIITGEYRTAVEREKGAAGTTHSNVFGYQQVKGTNSTLSMSVVWRNGASITSFVGQCHVCREGSEPIIATAWILRVRVGSCDDNWKSTMFGSNTFTRHEQKTGPRKAANKHVPERDGEASDLTLCGGGMNLGCGLHSVIAALLVYFIYTL